MHKIRSSHINGNRHTSFRAEDAHFKEKAAFDLFSGRQSVVALI